MLSIESLNILKYRIYSKKTVLFIICSTYENKYEKISKEEESMEILKSFGLSKKI